MRTAEGGEKFYSRIVTLRVCSVACSALLRLRSPASAVWPSEAIFGNTACGADSGEGSRPLRSSCRSPLSRCFVSHWESTSVLILTTASCSIVCAKRTLIRLRKSSPAVITVALGGEVRASLPPADKKPQAHRG